MKSKISILIYLCFLAIPKIAGAGIVNNSGSSGQDSLTVPLFILDTLGDVVNVDTTADWGYIVVWHPGGDTAATDSFMIDGGNTDKIKKFGPKYAGVEGFAYRRPIASIDGNSGNGTYPYLVMVRDSSQTSWTPIRGEFQLYTTNDLSEKLDSITQVPDGEITASGIAADAIGASEIATDAIGAAEIAANAITSSEIATSAIDFGVELDTGGLGASGWAHGTRTLTALDEDATTLDLNATTIGTVTNLTNNNPNLDGATGTLSDAQIDLLTVTFLNDSLRTMYNKLLNDSTVTQARLDSLIKLTQAVASANEINPNASVYFVTKQGNDANNGRSWATAFLTTQEALETVNNSGNSLLPQYIFVGPGTWTITDSDTILVRNVHLIGSGYERTTIYNNSGNGESVIQIGDTVGGASVNNASHVEIAGLAIVNENTSTGSDGIWINRGDSVHVHHCSFSSVYQGIFNRSYNKSSYIHDNVIRRYGHDGIVTNAQFDRIYNNVVFADTLEAANADGIGANGRHGIYYNNIVVCSLTAFGTAATQAKRNVFANNFAYSQEPSGEFAYQYLVGDNHFLVGNWSQTKLQTAMGLNPADSSGSIQDELYALYAKQNLDSLAGRLDSSQFDNGYKDMLSDSIYAALLNVMTVAEADSLFERVKTIRDSIHGNTFSATGASACNGSGPVSCTLDVRNASGGLGYVTITINNTSNVEVYRDVADVSGFVYFNLDQSTTYRVLAGGLAGSVHDSLPYQTLVTTTTNHIRDTVPMTTTAIGTPSAATLKRVYDYLYDVAGNPIQGADVIVEVIMPDSTIVPYDTSTTVSVGKSPYPVTAKTDAAGLFTIDLIPSNYIRPAGSRYKISVVYSGRIVYSVAIRANGTTTALVRSLQ